MLSEKVIGWKIQLTRNDPVVDCPGRIEVYFAESQIPEFAGMRRAQRQFFKSAAIEMLTGNDRLVRWIPVILCATSSLIAAFSVVALWKSPEDPAAYMFVFFASVGLAGFAGGFVGNQFLFHKLRQHLKVLIH